MWRYRRILYLLLFLGFLLALFEWSGLRRNLSVEYLHQALEANLYRGLLLYIALFCLGNLLHIPGWIFLAGAVFSLGKIWGGVATYAAAVLSCCLTYFLIRAIGGDALRVIHNRWVVKILHRLDTHPVSSISALRVLCQTMPTVNYVLALSGVRFHHYLLGTLIGLPLPIALYCLFFDYLARILHWH
ncbi:VTT domain-containing protein [Herbaspirillum sp. LeCh32-8]|uniref:TVP38/TMEM64 family protein n=1 Tax=Herbaspirillum sp. LeCh32-8 TaxID=2821356 RepID=UPI001AE7EE4A|nr:VTT domain-containing protein [Herbaspirillum sp. LeCh32-8]MBP0596623.1 VTT domain-containing protein [Herbaspirillum sp. LeCh32-8]